MALAPGTMVGPYEIGGSLGAGGMGEVYRARDTKLKREVAVKVLPEILATDRARKLRFEREAELLASLNHPNIAHLYGLEDAGAVHALVMELVDGATLAERIAQRKRGAANPIKYTWGKQIENTAFEVDTALNDTHPGLTNVVAGSGKPLRSDAGKGSSAEPAVFKHKAILISVNKTGSGASLYEATRYAWKINKSKAEQSEIILATVQGLIVGAFVAEEWFEATAANFPGRQDVPGRLGFKGREAPAEIAALYVGKRVPDEYRKRGAAYPIKYTWGK